MSEFRARSNAEILDAAFEIYRRFFPTFFAISLVATLPMAVTHYLSSAWSLLDLAAAPRGVMLSWLLSAVITPFTEGALVVTASNAYLGTTVDIATSFGTALARPFRLFTVVWIRGILMGIGFVFFIIPGLVVFKRYFAVIPAVTLEKCSVGQAIKRSRELSADNGARIFLLLGAVILFMFFIGAMLGGFAAAIAPGAIAALLYLGAAALIGPFPAIVLTLLYYDIRIRKDGYDIELLANALNTPATASVRLPTPV
jgi:hypothetical protein